MRNAKNLIQHELIGLQCEVVKAKNRSLEGIGGNVLDETMKTIVVETKTGRKAVMKKDAVFRFSLPVSDGHVKVDVDGDFIIARPEDRIKKRMRRW